MQRARRQRIIKVLSDLVNGLLLVLLLPLAILGTVATFIAAFAGGVFTLGLAVWPLVILGLLASWGPLFLASALARFIGPRITVWADRKEVDPKFQAFDAAIQARWAKKREYAMESSRKRL